MKTFNFDILRKNGSTYEYTGLTFSNKRAVDIYLDKFVTKSERYNYYIKSYIDSQNKNAYGSIEELLQSHPEKEIDMLEVMKDNIKRRIYLPFPLTIESNKRIKQCYHMSLDDIENVLRYVENAGNSESLEHKLNFILDKVKDYEHRIISGQLSLDEYRALKELKEKTLDELDEIDSKIEEIAESLSAGQVSK